MRGVIEGVNYKAEWDKTSWLIGGTWYSLNGKHNVEKGTEVVFDVFTTNKGNHMVSNGKYSVANAQAEQQAPQNTARAEPGQVPGQKLPSNMAPPSGEGMLPEPRQHVTDTQMEIWCQAVLKAWVGPSDQDHQVRAKVAYVYELYPQRHNLGSPVSEGLSDPEFTAAASYGDEPHF